MLSIKLSVAVIKFYTNVHNPLCVWRQCRKRMSTWPSNTKSSRRCDGPVSHIVEAAKGNVYFGTCTIWNFPGLVVIAESREAEGLVMRDRETFATVIVRRSYRTMYFYARERSRVHAFPRRRIFKGHRKQTWRTTKNIFHIFIARSINILNVYPSASLKEEFYEYLSNIANIMAAIYVSRVHDERGRVIWIRYIRCIEKRSDYHGNYRLYECN